MSRSVIHVVKTSLANPVYSVFSKLAQSFSAEFLKGEPATAEDEVELAPGVSKFILTFNASEVTDDEMPNILKKLRGVDLKAALYTLAHERHREEMMVYEPRDHRRSFLARVINEVAKQIDQNPVLLLISDNPKIVAQRRATLMQHIDKAIDSAVIMLVPPEKVIQKKMAELSLNDFHEPLDFYESPRDRPQRHDRSPPVNAPRMVATPRVSAPRISAPRMSAPRNPDLDAMRERMEEMELRRNEFEAKQAEREQKLRQHLEEEKSRADAEADKLRAAERKFEQERKLWEQEEKERNKVLSRYSMSPSDKTPRKPEEKSEIHVDPTLSDFAKERLRAEKCETPTVDLSWLEKSEAGIDKFKAETNDRLDQLAKMQSESQNELKSMLQSMMRRKKSKSSPIDKAVAQKSPLAEKSPLGQKSPLAEKSPVWQPVSSPARSSQPSNSEKSPEGANLPLDFMKDFDANQQELASDFVFDSA